MVHLFSGCRKDKSDPPVIEISGPLSDQDFFIGDTIHVIADIHDDKEITGITCSLVNGDNIPMLPVAIFSAYKTHVKINFYFVISNNEIQTGDYNISVFATDGESDTRARRPVFITEIPRLLKRVFITTAGLPGNNTVYTADTGALPNMAIQVAGDFIAADAITRKNLFFTAGQFSGHVNAFNAATLAPEWSIQNISTGGAPYFTGISSDKNLIYVGYHDGKIAGFNEIMNQQFLALTDINSFPTITLSHANRLIAVEEFITGGGSNLVIFNNPGGVAINISPLNITAEVLLPKNNGTIYVIGNDNGTGKIYVCDLLTAQLEIRQTLTNNVILDATRINEYFLILSTASGIMEYDYNSNTLIPLVQGLKTQLVKYDDAANEVYAAQGNQMFVYGYQLHTLVPLYNRTLPDSVMSVNFLYNREKFD